MRDSREDIIAEGRCPACLAYGRMVRAGTRSGGPQAPAKTTPTLLAITHTYACDHCGRTVAITSPRPRLAPYAESGQRTERWMR